MSRHSVETWPWWKTHVCVLPKQHTSCKGLTVILTIYDSATYYLINEKNLQQKRNNNKNDNNNSDNNVWICLYVSMHIPWFTDLFFYIGRSRFFYQYIKTDKKVFFCVYVWTKRLRSYNCNSSINECIYQ